MVRFGSVAGREPVAFLAEIEQLRVEPDQTARVVIEEASGTIVMGAQVRVSTVAIAQGNLTIRVTETPQVSQPNPLGRGDTVVTQKADIAITQQGGSLVAMPAGARLADVVKALNSLGAAPQDLLGSAAMADLIQLALETYDCIVIDTPPIGVVTDAATVATMSDAVIMVTRWQKTPVAALQSSVALLRAAKAPLAGVVLNDANPRRLPAYAGGANYATGGRHPYFDA